MPDNSVDSIVTDPPYELGFMGKSWDNSGIAYNVELWSQAFRVLKPGGHLLAFGGSRTYHRLASAVEDAGFEIRDQIMWIYGTGFPKSMDVAKAMDKSAGVQGEKVGERTFGKTSTGQGSGWNENAVAATGKQDVFAPASEESKKWKGWGTALKPAHEPIVLARKPVIGTVANNVLTYGTGALNIDGSRVEIGTGETKTYADRTKLTVTTVDQGRWPANVIHDGSEEVLEYFGEPQRFFYCAKASKSERNAGLEGLPNFHPTVKPIALMRYLIKLVTPPNGTVLDPFLGSGTTAMAATLEGFKWIGCEITKDYWPIIEARVAWAEDDVQLLERIRE